MTPNEYWKSFFGIELFKVEYKIKEFLYRVLGIALPKMRSQREYWAERGRVYMEEVLTNGCLDRELFFQNMLVEEARKLTFDSCFEAGCGFGWNARRMKEEFPHVVSGGLDFSQGQLDNVPVYCKGMEIPVVQGDICKMPLPDKSYDLGYSVGVFMNIHPDKIGEAVDEMIRVCRKYVIHLEYDESQAAEQLREQRRFKTNIVSHDYRRLYESRGKTIRTFRTFAEFGNAYRDFISKCDTTVTRWEGYEGGSKYVLVVVEL